MKKDKQWVKDEATKKIQNLFNISEPNYFDFESTNKAIRSVIDQLDEPEVLSSNWIKDNQLMWTSIHGAEYYVPANKLYGKIVPKQELPTVPQFVSNWIEETKKQSKTLVFAIAHIYDKNEMDESPSKEEKRIFQWMELDDNDEIFARAWLDGYEVEEEQKYYVILEENSYGAMGLGIDSEGSLTFTATHDKWSLPKLTEREIKDYDKRFWPFAVKVEELEE